MMCLRAAKAEAREEAGPAPGSSAPFAAGMCCFAPASSVAPSTAGDGTGMSLAGQCSVFTSEGLNYGQR